MDRATYSLRPHRDSDYEPVARINAIINPRIPETADDGRRVYEVITGTPGHLVLKWVVEDVRSESVVAWGGLAHTISNFHPQKFYARVAVHPVHRGRGIGQEVYALLEREAISRGAICLWSDATEDDPRSVRFQERQGFVPLRKLWLSRLDLSELDRSSVPDRSQELTGQGFRFTTLAAEGADCPEVRKRLFELSIVSSEDAPRLGEYAPMTFEQFAAIELDDPKSISEAIFLACEGGRYVAWSSLQRVLGSPETLDIGFTGTLPMYRGRGLASELKRQAVEYARSRGFRSVITSNDSLNPRIWAINEKLGFRKEAVWVRAEKLLPPPRPGG